MHARACMLPCHHAVILHLTNSAPIYKTGTPQAPLLVKTVHMITSPKLDVRAYYVLPVSAWFVQCLVCPQVCFVSRSVCLPPFSSCVAAFICMSAGHFVCRLPLQSACPSIRASASQFFCRFPACLFVCHSAFPVQNSSASYVTMSDTCFDPSPCHLSPVGCLHPPECLLSFSVCLSAFICGCRSAFCLSLCAHSFCQLPFFACWADFCPALIQSACVRPQFVHLLSSAVCIRSLLRIPVRGRLPGAAYIFTSAICLCIG